MSSKSCPASTPTDVPSSEEREQRERLDRVFGDVLPDATRDERRSDGSQGHGSQRDNSESNHDDELRRNVPPHHG